MGHSSKFIQKITLLMKVNVTVQEPMRVIILALAPVFFELALAVQKMFGISVLIDEVVGIEQTLFSHRLVCKEYWLKESKYCPYRTFIYRNLL
jgi:uncharacterized membrane protein